MSDTERRTTAGVAIGGIAAGAISGEWGRAAVGAAVDAASGYVYDQHKKNEEQAYSQGPQDARSR
jgi:outer membrane lipoprotein SlyB